jgi:hypothetical protein
MNTSTLAQVPERAGPPPQASRLAYAGLIPFVLGAALVWLVYPYPDAHAFVALSLAAYGAAVLAYLGGVHWGLTMDVHGEPPRARLWSVVPPLAGTLAVVMPPYAGLVVLGAMLIVSYLVDRRLYPEAGLGHWLTLRFRLSLIAALCCFLAAAST